MRVLLVHEHYLEHGGESSVFELERRALLDAGVELVEYVRDNAELREYGLGRRLSLPLRTVWAWDAQRELAALIARTRPALAHFHNSLPLISPAAYWTCQRAGVAVVQTLHNYRLGCPAATFFRDGGTCEECPEHGLQRAVVHACYRQSRPASATVAGMLAVHRRLGSYERQVDRYIALSAFARDKLIARAGLPAGRVVVKPHFLADDPGPVARLGEGALFVGRLAEYKGILPLMAAVEGPVPAIDLRVIGGGPLEERVRALAARQASIEVLGARPAAEVVDWIRRAAVLVVPSLWYEALPMVILEAFACGVPVIASRIGSLPELVRDGVTGFLVEPGDVLGLRATLQLALADRARLQVMGQTARAEFEARYSYAIGQAALLRLYREIADLRRAS